MRRTGDRNVECSDCLFPGSYRTLYRVWGWRRCRLSCGVRYAGRLLFPLSVLTVAQERERLPKGLARYVGAGCSLALHTPCHVFEGEAEFHSIPRSRNTTRHLRGHVPWRRCGISNRKTNVAAVIELAYANPFMNRTPRHIFLPALLGAILAASAAAQQAKPIANWANLNQLVTGARSRSRLPTGRPYVGSCSA